jgi:aryl-alcohol dehydrogenase-like predicted oxidoreductase
MMQTRQLGTSEIQITPVTFGAWAIGGWMWGGQEHQDAIAAIHAALDKGINAIDTAAVYGFGQSEQLVAEALKDRRRDDVVIMTKFGLRWDLPPGVGIERWKTHTNDGKPVTVVKYASPESVREECERSLRRLKTDYIDVFQIHWPDDTTPIAETFGAVKDLIDEGKIRAAGVSNYSPEQMAEAHAVCKLASSQPPFSMVNRQSEPTVIKWCRETHVGVVVYSPLQRGLLTGKFSPDHEFPDDDHRGENAFFKAENIRRVNAFLSHCVQPVADSHGATVAQVVIAWTIHRAGITAALVGARNTRQAQENAAALQLELSEADLRQIDEGLAGLELVE